jgi:hypothetical protein
MPVDGVMLSVWIAGSNPKQKKACISTGFSLSGTTWNRIEKQAKVLQRHSTKYIKLHP